MNLKEKFEQEKLGRTFKLYDINHKYEWYLGYSESGKKTILLINPDNNYNINFESSQYISVNIQKRKDGKIVLFFSLETDKLEEIFYKFCEDIIEFTRNVEGNIFKEIYDRWNMWRNIFKRVNDGLLTEKQIKGLIGEILVLKNIILKNYNEEEACEYWQGPFEFHKDFEMPTTWHEVKAINESKLTITISSVEQLSSKIRGELDVVLLENTNKNAYESITLNSLVNDINNTLTNEKAKYIFNKILIMSGYSYNEKYDNYSYRVIGINRYNVEGEDFPRLNKDELKKGITKVSYDILLNEIERYKI